MQQSISGDRVMITGGSDIVTARHRGRILALALGFEETEVVQLTTVVSELGRNILAHSGSGEMVFQAVVEDGRPGMVLTARDRATRIPKLGPELRQTWVDGLGAFGDLDSGLLAVSHLVNLLQVTWEPSVGSTVTVKKWLLDQTADSRYRETLTAN